MKRILVPYDFSELSEHALDFACQIAHRVDSEIMLLNVIEHPTVDSFKTMGIQNEDPMEVLYIKRLYERVKERMNEVVANAKYSNDKITTKIQLGNAFNTIIDQIMEEKVSLLIAGTEGAEGLNEFFVGSNAERIVRKSSCPVITISGKAELEPIEKIVFASDFMNTDNDFIAQLKELQSTFEAHLNIVKINTPANFTSTRHDTRQMEDFISKYKIENCTMMIYNHNNEEDGIIHCAEDIQADMIALGTHQRKGIGHFLAGSIAEDVVNHATIPVWTAHLNA
ncbi:MAG: universal stress protein [Bacteroidota bacterium]